MKRKINSCLVLMLLTYSACSTEVGKSEILTPNNQPTNLNKVYREINGNLAETNTRKKQQVVQIDKISIKNTTGLVVLSDRYGEKDFIRFYNEDGSLWYEFSFHYDDSDGKFDYENENFLPFSFHPDYFTLALKCVAEDKNRYEVIVNEETGLRKFVKKNDRTLKFETWEKHITETFAVNFNQGENPLREAPEGNVKKADLPEEATFHPLEIKGDWLKVSWGGPEKTKKDDKSAWIRWRDSDNLLVELFYFA